MLVYWGLYNEKNSTGASRISTKMHLQEVWLSITSYGQYQSEFESLKIIQNSPLRTSFVRYTLEILTHEYMEIMGLDKATPFKRGCGLLNSHPCEKNHQFKNWFCLFIFWFWLNHAGGKSYVLLQSPISAVHGPLEMIYKGLVPLIFAQ